MSPSSAPHKSLEWTHAAGSSLLTTFSRLLSRGHHLLRMNDASASQPELLGRSDSPPPQEPPLKVVLSRAWAQSAETDVPTGVGKQMQWWLAVGQCTVSKHAAHGQHAVCTWTTHGQHTACAQSAHGQHAVTLWPACDQCVVSTRPACARMRSAHLKIKKTLLGKICCGWQIVGLKRAPRQDLLRFAHRGVRARAPLNFGTNCTP